MSDFPKVSLAYCPFGPSWATFPGRAPLAECRHGIPGPLHSYRASLLGRPYGQPAPPTQKGGDDCDGGVGGDDDVDFGDLLGAPWGLLGASGGSLQTSLFCGLAVTRADGSGRAVGARGGRGLQEKVGPRGARVAHASAARVSFEVGPRYQIEVGSER
eukprot:6812475-Pyramimonas_sp.AAC.3